MTDQAPSNDSLTAAAPGADPSLGVKYPDGRALALSGGGYKAAAYHLGGLIRLNELGVLRGLKRVVSVSGGSITAAHLGLHWGELEWDGDVARNFDSVVVEPLARFLTGVNIDVMAFLAGVVLPGRKGADGVERAYARHLFGKATLQDLPDEADGPRFVIVATNYQLNSLWRFSRSYAADYRIGKIEAPRFPLARIVAASSGFPPFFCPIELDLRDHVVEPWENADMHRPPFTERAVLADGGIYDNTGMEPIWNQYGKLLVSNAGNPFDERPDPPTNWLTMLRRVLAMIHRQAENNRVRWLFDRGRTRGQTLVYWPLRNDPAGYPRHGPLYLSPAELDAVMHQSVRLWSLKSADYRLLLRHGYLLADAAVRSYLIPAAPPPTKLP